MRLASFVLSLALHAILFLAIWFWPSPKLIKLDAPPVLISLVDGAPGGNRAPSPILGPQGSPGEKLAPSMPAPQKNEAAPAQDTATPIAQPKDAPQKPEVKPEPKQKPKPKEPEPEAKPIAEKKKPDVKKEEHKKEPEKEKPKKEEKKQEAPKKDAPKDAKKDAKPSSDPVKAALDKARAASSREAGSPNRGSAVERALAEAKRKSGGFGGGGGGEGDGPGGGGLGDVYLGQVMMAVRPNWGFASASRSNLVCFVRVQVDAQGKVLNARLERSSGNAQFDASAVNAVIRTGTAGQFPPPPGPEYFDLILSFNLNEMMGR